MELVNKIINIPCILSFKAYYDNDGTLNTYDGALVTDTKYSKGLTYNLSINGNQIHNSVITLAITTYIKTIIDGRSTDLTLIGNVSVKKENLIKGKEHNFNIVMTSSISYDDKISVDPESYIFSYRRTIAFLSEKIESLEKAIQLLATPTETAQVLRNERKHFINGCSCSSIHIYTHTKPNNAGLVPYKKVRTSCGTILKVGTTSNDTKEKDVQDAMSLLSAVASKEVEIMENDNNVPEPVKTSVGEDAKVAKSSSSSSQCKK